MTIEIRRRLERALAKSGAPSSDYDLNADVKLPSERRLRPAGVLAAVSSRPTGSVILLTKRAPTLKHHPGQIAFPGGKVDDGDTDPSAAALREAREEIGLPSDMVDVIGCLPPHETVTGFQVTPVLALVDPLFKPIPEPGEVAEIFEVPLAHVLDRDRFSIQSRRWRGTRRAYYTVPWGPYYIWGATARMLCALADRMADETD
ncbi:CoA pyrophosphatase [Boseongicola aestuarii]|uniref:Putative NUDIX hydrolase n=1 Tax=Boseongicola aestuarii TaxID=1470561 RepID=A0A238J4S7_9RHOB|nr:CoA pyrophosphatase [Boseongicola aestuarii]SMX24960.1 putative NUDIX hydrolase [Boseongicola aestuarii]